MLNLYIKQTNQEKIEIWKEINGFPNYRISNWGTLRNLKTGNIFTAVPGKYRKTSIYHEGEIRRVSLHRLTLEAFKGSAPSDAHECAHNDGSKDNNHISNLRWATKKENAQDRILHGATNLGKKLKRRASSRYARYGKSNFQVNS